MEANNLNLSRAPRPRPTSFEVGLFLFTLLFRTLHQVSPDLHRPPAVHPPLPELTAQPEPTNETSAFRLQFGAVGDFPVFVLFGSLGLWAYIAKIFGANFGNIDDFDAKLPILAQFLGHYRQFCLGLWHCAVINVNGYRGKT
jgi:hypothetical protein